MENIKAIKEQLNILLSPFLEEIWDALSQKEEVISRLLPLMGDKIKFRIPYQDSDVLEIIIKRRKQQTVINETEEEENGSEN